MPEFFFFLFFFFLQDKLLRISTLKELKGKEFGVFVINVFGPISAILVCFKYKSKTAAPTEVWHG